MPTGRDCLNLHGGGKPDQDQRQPHEHPQGGRGDGGGNEGLGHVDRLVGVAVVELRSNSVCRDSNSQIGVYCHDRRS